MTSQRIILGDCLDVFANERNVPAFVSDPPGHVGKNGFMGRIWDRGRLVDDFTLRMPARSKEHERELRREEGFIRYWATRYAMAYDIADQHAVNIVWTLPRTSYQTATALRAAGWDIKDNLVHLFGSGWAKTGNALAPGQEGWILATKGKPDLDIDACRVPRGGEDMARNNASDTNLPWGGTFGHGPNAAQRRKDAGLPPLGSLPKNAVLSHCEGCVLVGSKRVSTGKFTNDPKRTRNANRGNCYGDMPSGEHPGFSGKTESVPAFHCLAGCVCGASVPWPDDRPLPKCPCGETWRWLCPVAEVNGQSGDVSSGGSNGSRNASTNLSLSGPNTSRVITNGREPDKGGAARYFNTFKYLSKCSPSERHAGCENLYWKADKKDPFGFVQVTREEWESIPVDNEHLNCIQKQDRRERTGKAQGNVHPTVKSYRLMHWLHSLTGAKRILDLTAGSGTGMYTAFLDGIEWLGAEICPQAIVIAEARLAFWKGLSFDARRAFMEDDVVTEPQKRDERELTLFSGLA